MEQSIFNCKINYKNRLLHLISLCEIAEYEQPHGRIWNRIGVKKRGTGEKIVVAIWACFLLFNHDFQIWVCFFFFFFSVWMVFVDMWMTLLIVLAACSVRLGLSCHCLMLLCRSCIHLFAVIWGTAHLPDDSLCHRCWSGSFCLTKQNWILMKKLMYCKMTPNGVKLHFAS